MNMVSKERVQEIVDYYTAHGKQQAMAYYGISKEETFDRYLRLARAYDESPVRTARVLLFDIETLPMHVRVWGLYKQRIPHTNIVKDWIVLSWAAKWLTEPEMMFGVLTPKEARQRDDRRICKSIWSLIDQADIVIAHNGDRFDIRKLNSRFLVLGMNPPSAYRTIDTLKQSQTVFAHSSNRLDYLGKLKRNEGKIDTNFDLWVRCESGVQEALDEMIAYNKEDVNLLEEVYLWMRPWMRSHPNLGLYMDLKKPVCAHCGSLNLVNNGYYYATAGKYASIRCSDCGALGRIRDTALSNTDSKTLIRSHAR